MFRGILALTLLTANLIFASHCWSGQFIGQAVVGSNVHGTQPDYQYRTAFATPKPIEKNLWDYLSFFSMHGGAESDYEFPAAEAEELRARTRELARQLIDNGREDIVDGYVITVNTFVNLNNLYKTSSLGRYLGEQIIGEFQSAGIEVIDVRKANTLMIHQYSGEYGLSRDMEELNSSLGSQAMVVGTYSYANGQILLNARVLRNRDGMVMSHANLAFALDKLTTQMLMDEAAPPRRGSIISIESVN